MTKDNASGAGMEPVASVSRSNDMEGLVQWADARLPVGTLLVRHTDATRLLAESQAHNTKLEANLDAVLSLLVDRCHLFNDSEHEVLAEARAALKP